MIVVNYGGGALTRLCVESAAQDLSPVDWSAIVVANSAGDDPEPDALRAPGAQVRARRAYCPRLVANALKSNACP